MSKIQTRVCPPRLLLMLKHPVGEEINKNDPSLPKKIQHSVKEERVHKIVHYGKTERLSECFMGHMKDFLTEFNCYELFFRVIFSIHFYKKIFLSRDGGSNSRSS